MLSRTQKVVVLVWTALVLLMGFFPPWLYVVDLPQTGSSWSSIYAETPAGYCSIFSKPAWPKYGERNSRVAQSGAVNVFIAKRGYAAIDYRRLLFQLFLVTLVALGVGVVVRGTPGLHDRAVGD